MKKFKSTFPINQGLKFFDKYLESELSAEVFDAMQALIADFSTETEGFILTGGTVAGLTGAATITDSIVVLNGKILRLAADTALSYPFYIQEATTVSINGAFGDGTNQPIIDNEAAETAVSPPGAGQYITIAAAGDYVAGLNAKITAKADASLEAWADVTFANSWEAGENSMYNGLRYRKDNFGNLWLNGVIESPIVGDYSGTIITTLPAGYRPVNGIRFLVGSFVGKVGYIEVSATSGVVSLGVNEHLGTFAANDELFINEQIPMD